MSISARQVKNKRNQEGVSTARSGVVYDVFIRYKTSEGYKTYGKRGFATKQEAIYYEAEMRLKLVNPNFEIIKSVDEKQTVKEYLDSWVDVHGKANLRPSTFSSYKSNIRVHIVPYIGNVPLKKLTPAMLDKLFQELVKKGLSQSTVRYIQRILGVALEAARKYRYIDSNPARDILTKFGKQAKTPDPYTVEQMQELMRHCIGNEWRMIIVLSGMYGLRRNEVLGLRWSNVDLKNMRFSVVEQLPYKVPLGTNIIDEMAPTKSTGRKLPITEITLPYFKKQIELQKKQKELSQFSEKPYYDNNLVVAKTDGTPIGDNCTTKNFNSLLKQLGMPHIRFHDLRHSAATNMHQLTGDFYTVGEILGHSLKGIGMTLGISSNLDSVTAQYVDVRLERKLFVLDAYHNALHTKEAMEMVNMKTEVKEREGR